MKYAASPDGRCFVHKERLWRCTSPNLEDETRHGLVAETVSALREVAAAKRPSNEPALAAVRLKPNAGGLMVIA